MARDETGTITLDSWMGLRPEGGRQRMGREVERGEVPRLRRSRISQTLQFMKDPVGLLEEAQKECGDIFCLGLLGMGDWVFLCSPELVQELYRVPDTHLSAGPANKKFMGGLLGADSLFCLDGEEHLERRRLLFPLLNGHEALERTERVDEWIDRALADWETDTTISLLSRFVDLNLQAYILSVFDDIEPERVRRIASLARDFLEKGLQSPLVMMPALRLDLGPRSPWGKILKMREDLRRALTEEIEERLANPSPEARGLVDRLLQSTDGSGPRLDTETLVQELCTLAAGSNEAMPKLLTWTVMGVLSNPEVVPKIRAELDRVVGDGPIRAEHIDQLEYLEAVIYEGMRFQPSTDTAGVRRALRPTLLGGYVVPEGAVVTQCLSAIARRPELFAQVDRFEPEHFLGTGLKAHHWKPFGGGHRTCTGKGFALVGMKLVVAHLFRRFDVEAGPGGSEAQREGFFRIPRGGGEVILRPRNRGAVGVSDMSAGVADMSRPSPSSAPPTDLREAPEVSKPAASRCPFAFLHRS